MPVASVAPGVMLSPAGRRTRRPRPAPVASCSAATSTILLVAVLLSAGRAGVCAGTASGAQLAAGRMAHHLRVVAACWAEGAPVGAVPAPGRGRRAPTSWPAAWQACTSSKACRRRKQPLGMHRPAPLVSRSNTTGTGRRRDDRSGRWNGRWHCSAYVSVHSSMPTGSAKGGATGCTPGSAHSGVPGGLAPCAGARCPPCPASSCAACASVAAGASSPPDAAGSAGKSAPCCCRAPLALAGPGAAGSPATAAAAPGASAGCACRLAAALGAAAGPAAGPAPAAAAGAPLPAAGTVLLLLLAPSSRLAMPSRSSWHSWVRRSGDSPAYPRACSKYAAASGNCGLSAARLLACDKGRGGGRPAGPLTPRPLALPATGNSCDTSSSPSVVEHRHGCWPARTAWRAPGAGVAGRRGAGHPPGRCQTAWSAPGCCSSCAAARTPTPCAGRPGTAAARGWPRRRPMPAGL